MGVTMVKQAKERLTLCNARQQRTDNALLSPAGEKVTKVSPRCAVWTSCSYQLSLLKWGCLIEADICQPGFEIKTLPWHALS